MTRCFLGIPLPEHVKKDLKDIQKRVEKYCFLKSVELENVHITLKFLGEQNESAIKKMINSLDKLSFHSYRLKVRGIHVFPSLDRVNVFSLGVEPEKETIDLNNRANHLLGTKEDREFVPHITLARVKGVKDKPGLLKFINENKSFSSQEFEVNNFVLYKSTLTGQGPVYEVIKRFDLK